MVEWKRRLFELVPTSFRVPSTVYPQLVVTRTQGADNKWQITCTSEVVVINVIDGVVCVGGAVKKIWKI